jgi:hypothetical protein
MSLAHPLWLLVLLLLPLLALAQRWRRGRGTAYAVRFPAVGTVALALAEEGRARWLRALPVVALLGAPVGYPSRADQRRLPDAGRRSIGLDGGS